MIARIRAESTTYLAHVRSLFPLAWNWIQKHHVRHRAITYQAQICAQHAFDMGKGTVLKRPAS